MQQVGKGKAYYADTNGMPKADGRVTHLGLTDGELAPRIVTVGSLSRAKRLRACLDGPTDKTFELASDRGFTTFTGAFDGVPVSVVATGMGAPMMDFLVREARAVVDGPMLFVRFGSCGGLRADAVPGTICVNTPGAVYVQRDYDAFAKPATAGGTTSAYTVSQVVAPDGELAEHARDAMRDALGARLIEGLNASADSFYGSQGRLDGHFDDRNEDCVERVLEMHADVASMEMESFQLLHLARCANPKFGAVRAATAAIVCANRASGDVITGEALHECEDVGGRAVLKAITSCPLGEDHGEDAPSPSKRARR